MPGGGKYAIRYRSDGAGRSSLEGASFLSVSPSPRPMLAGSQRRSWPSWAALASRPSGRAIRAVTAALWRPSSAAGGKPAVAVAVTAGSQRRSWPSWAALASRPSGRAIRAVTAALWRPSSAAGGSQRWRWR